MCIIHGCISPGLATLVQGNVPAADAWTQLKNSQRAVEKAGEGVAKRMECMCLSGCVCGMGGQESEQMADIAPAPPPPLLPTTLLPAVGAQRVME